MVERFKRFWNEMDRQRVDQVGQLYAPNVIFEDPAHRLVGLDALRNYLAGLYGKVEHCQFAFEHEVLGTGAATLTWTMSLRHPQLRGGRLIEVPGASYFRFDTRIEYHRDYFDLGALLYENVPLLGGLVRQVKRRL